MTPDEVAAEKIKSLASAVYRQMDQARQAENYVRTIVGRHGDHPAFKQWMREMHLTETVEEFVSRPVMKNG